MNIDELLKFDPLATAEKITGESYKDDKDTAYFGMGIALLHNKAKTAALAKTNDTYMNMSFAYALAVFLDLGFDVVYEEEFDGSYDDDETYLMLWHPDGILGVLESYNGYSTNHATIYYNWMPHPGVSRWEHTSSGHMAARLDLDIWVGSHDAREGLRHDLNALRENGTFISTWDERPFLWLLNYKESRRENSPADPDQYEMVNEKKISCLPSEVFDAITPKEEK